LLCWGAWARTLSRQFRSDPIVTPAWIQNARGKFCATTTPSPGDVIAQIAFERGNFSTLLGFTIYEDKVEGIALGDSVLFVETATTCLSIPAMSVEDFKRNPVLLSSHPGIGAFTDTQEAISAAGFVVPAPCDGWSGARFFAATDGVAEWVMADQARRLSILAGLSCQADFSTLVETEISIGRMRYDDATVILAEP
jgi:hypothetical protein